MKTVTLKKSRDFSVIRRHPWIFSGAIAHIDGEPESGESVRVVSQDGDDLGKGAYSPESQIRVRMWSFDSGVEVDEDFIFSRVASSVGARAYFLAEGDTNAFRLINSEADGLPGVIADKYGDWVVCQFTSAGAERWKSVIVDALQRLSGCSGVYERSDVDVRVREGLPEVTGLLAGDEPPEQIEINEGDCRYMVNVREGHKTGFYLDQRDNRAIIKTYANNADVLNAFSYTGGFGIAAVTARAATVTHVDLSESALELAKSNTALNTCEMENSSFIKGDVFEVLRKFRDQARSFDVIVLDPPKFADSKGRLMKAARGYKDINLLGIKLLKPGGILATFSCSGLMTPDLFHKVVSDAAVDAGRDVQVLQRLQQACDHPEGLCFPEGLYLKGLLCRVI
ncbi:MAG: class I SAM-dependent methyltransferase [Kiritimatiellae bacterium]|jgi:23S rRNA (cytosine1962-C5)-methyltransferase|nr:class I SAM-dependent methyltransferase [Kiritimatiellia bacterium]